ncbi:MAG: OmpA family protein [Caulobacteraceae bacterium]|nr:OmpA family protein [Caulobacteraceae bacterium]
MLSSLAAAMTVLATPVTAHEFLDYFAYGRTELSPAGYQMVRSVAPYSRTGHPKRILIAAHMDTAEAGEFSEELSRQRAQRVATELVMLGIDPALLEMQGRGASALARPTPPDTSEPLNRRVTVGIYF